MPEVAQVALDDGGSWLLVEDEAARVTPCHTL